MQNRDALNNEYIYVIKNGNPSSVNSWKIWRKTERILQKKGLRYYVYNTEYAGHAKKIAEEILKNHTTRAILLVVGGDGTLHEVINGAARFSHAVVACVPAGSGNDYARGVQKILNIKQVIQLLNEPDVSTFNIDLGKMRYMEEDKFFVNSLGLGFDASICKVVNESKRKKFFQKWKLGKFIYLYYLFKQLFLFKPFPLHIEVDGRRNEYNKVWFIVVANQPYFGGGLKVSPAASINEGKFHVIVVHNIPSYLFLLVFVTVIWGGHLKMSKWVDAFTCRQIHMVTEKEVPIQADGEVIGHSEVLAKVAPKKLKVISKDSRRKM